MKNNSNKPSETSPENNHAGNASVQPDKQSLQQNLMDSLEVMQLLHICRGTLYNWRKKGMVAFSKVGGASILRPPMYTRC